MTLSQIDYMDVFANGGAINRWVVLVKDTQEPLLIRCHLRNKRPMVVRFTVRLLAHGTADVRSHGVEVANRLCD